MSVIEDLRAYFWACPLLSECLPVHVDGLGPDPENYSIDPTGEESLLEEYMDGSRVRTFPFRFSAMRHAPEDEDRLEVNALFEALAQWMEKEENLPQMSGRRCAQRLRAVGGAALKQAVSGEAARYQMECELQYFEEAGA